MFDELIDQAAVRLDLGDKAGPLVKLCLQYILSYKNGLVGFLNQFSMHGVGQLAQSWMGNPLDAQALNHADVETVLGGEGGLLPLVAEKLGLERETAVTALGAVLPVIVGKLTPGGQIPVLVPEEVQSLAREGQDLLATQGNRATSAPAVAATTVSGAVADAADAAAAEAAKLDQQPLRIEPMMAPAARTEAGAVIQAEDDANASFAATGAATAATTFTADVAGTTVTGAVADAEDMAAAESAALDRVAPVVGPEVVPVSGTVAGVVDQAQRDAEAEFVAIGGAAAAASSIADVADKTVSGAVADAEDAAATVAAVLDKAGPAIEEVAAPVEDTVSGAVAAAEAAAGAMDKPISVKESSGASGLQNTTADDGTKSGGKKWWPWLLLAAAILLVANYCSSNKSAEQATQAPAAGQGAGEQAPAAAPNSEDAAQSKTPDTTGGTDGDLAVESAKGGVSGTDQTAGDAVSSVTLSTSQAAGSAAEKVGDAAHAASTALKDAAAKLPDGWGVLASMVSGKPALDVYFASGETAVGEDFGDKAQDLVVYLADHPDAKAVISGFHDATGGAAANEEISKERAQVVQSALLAEGVAEEQLVLEKPADTEGGEADDVAARRVEVVID